MACDHTSTRSVEIPTSVSAGYAAPWHRRGFSLIELLIVVLIASSVMAISLPAMGKARETAKNVTCKSNLRQVGIYTMRYVEEYDGELPDLYYSFNPGKSGELVILIKPPPFAAGGLTEFHQSVLICPADEKLETVPVQLPDGTTELWEVSYGHNLQLLIEDVKYWEVRNHGRTPAEVIFSYDGEIGASAQGNYKGAVDFVAKTDNTRHQDSLNALYLDGHVASKLAISEEEIDLLGLADTPEKEAKGEVNLGGKIKGNG
ncbi:MAG: prepilin-type N-terminal cleavage/methylation domain-containing protein, partial [Phycisphaeraceae bacterium]|nr:prepilin-type N-terminal cleavage/methylation domain-containing protein [Phycisphaeraceae bacterium]